MHLAHRFDRPILERVSDSDHGAGHAVNSHPHGRLGLALQALRFRFQPVEMHVMGTHQGQVAEQHRATVHVRAQCRAPPLLEAAGLAQARPRALRSADNSRAQRMLAAALGARCQFSNESPSSAVFSLTT